ncbi:hypothetical protein UO65_1219 [Actinokineospora spheciospongiae]|uniref:Uncharacterized protein n=1 Tax=Actinokineospora spheciospongiae TaxID=909613 RepID=W7J375_9PSEU|nr:hypothetical protein [Actinokineospora spheciospongiae]EWC63542.1 hypothetical protein UO65_1219 [Actinokineospora spheciospongiae]PWW64291.1 hypothetical protein DFQ13_103264 [Actinokineospora spheciospongiae]
MTIQDQAQQLLGLAEQLPTAHVQGLLNELVNVQAQVAGILGDTSSANSIQNAISRSQGLLNDVGSSLEQLRQEIQSAAQHHMRG